MTMTQNPSPVQTTPNHHCPTGHGVCAFCLLGWRAVCDLLLVTVPIQPIQPLLQTLVQIEQLHLSVVTLDLPWSWPLSTTMIA
jgi:hypothetical protein